MTDSGAYQILVYGDIEVNSGGNNGISRANRYRHSHNFGLAYRLESFKGNMQNKP
jgi:queuine/archaeosine tRNA-ribosyltransferase